MNSSLTSKMADYERLKERNARHSADINHLRTEVDNLKRQQREFKNEMTPRDEGLGGYGPHRGSGTERRPEMIYFADGDGSPKPPKDREEETGDKKPADDYFSDRPRQPGMYFLELDKTPRDDANDKADTLGRQNEPVRVERSPEMFWAGGRYDYSPRREKEKKYDVEELRQRDRENKYSFFDTTTLNGGKKKESGYKYPWDDNWVRLILLNKSGTNHHSAVYNFPSASIFGES